MSGARGQGSMRINAINVCLTKLYHRKKKLYTYVPGNELAYRDIVPVVAPLVLRHSPWTQMSGLKWFLMCHLK